MRYSFVLEMVSNGSKKSNLKELLNSQNYIKPSWKRPYSTDIKQAILNARRPFPDGYQLCFLLNSGVDTKEKVVGESNLSSTKFASHLPIKILKIHTYPLFCGIVRRLGHRRRMTECPDGRARALKLN